MKTLTIASLGSSEKLKNDSAEFYAYLIHHNIYNVSYITNINNCEFCLTITHVLDDKCNLVLQQITLDSPETDYYAKHYKYKYMDMYNLHLANTDMNCGINKRSEEKYVTTYLQRQDVMSRIHVDEKKVNWTDFSYSVHRSFDARHSTPSVEFPSCSIVANMTSFAIIEQQKP